MADESLTTDDGVLESESKAPDASVAESILAKYGSPVAAILQLAGENHKHRRRIASLKESAPKAGQVVLSQEDADALVAYRALGKPDEIKGFLEQGKTASETVKSMKKRESIRDVSGLLGYNEAVLARISDGLEFAIESKTEGGKTVKTATVKDGDAQPVSVEKYAEQHWSELMPALKPKKVVMGLTERPGQSKPEPQAMKPLGVRF